MSQHNLAIVQLIEDDAETPGFESMQRSACLEVGTTPIELVSSLSFVQAQRLAMLGRVDEARASVETLRTIDVGYQLHMRS